MIWIVSDSAQEITENLDQGVAVMPLPLIVNGQEYPGGKGISLEEFYSLLEQDENTLSTSQATPAMYEALFSKLTENGDEVVCITLSSTLSGTYNSARLAAQEFPGVYLVDSMNACLGQSALVERAIQLRGQNHSAEEIAKILDEDKKDLVLIAAVDTLKYLHKGGRLSAAAAVAGTLLGIKPIVTINPEGEVVVAGKARGTRKAHKQLASMVAAMEPDTDKPFVAGFSGIGEENLGQLRGILSQEGLTPEEKSLALSPILAVHAGPGAAGLGFFAKKRSV